jgi:putative zinc-binding metallo-peptidase
MRSASNTPRVSWEHRSDEDLLKVRICDLGLRIKRGSELDARIRQLYRELDQKGLAIRPTCYLADEWLSPDGQAAIGIPFFLAHPRLRALENRMMFEVEGGTPSWCMRLLRHEAGHAVDHAYAVSRREDWKDVFGSRRLRYNPYFYEVDPGSRRYVRNVPDYYAQSHPYEDFAETFAVWLNPNSRWRTRYAGWPALRKLRYVNRVAREIRDRRVPRKPVVLHSEARTSESTLGRYYARKFRVHRVSDLSFALKDLRTIFRRSRSVDPKDPASDFIRRHKRHIVESVAEWSGARASKVSRVVATLAQICDENGLVVRGEAAPTLVRVSTYAATLVVNQLRTHRWRLTGP